MGQCIMLVILLSRVSIHTSWILSLHFMRISTAHRKSVSGRIVVLRLESECFLGDWIWAETGQRGEGLQNASRGRWRHVMPPRHATCASGICLTSLRSGPGGGGVVQRHGHCHLQRRTGRRCLMPRSAASSGGVASGQGRKPNAPGIQPCSSNSSINPQNPLRTFSCFTQDATVGEGRHLITRYTLVYSVT